MRLFFVPIFVMLTITGYADRHISPPSLAPLSPATSEQPTFRGQSQGLGGSSELLSSVPPIARGPVEVEIEPKLMETHETPELEPGIVPTILTPANPNLNPNTQNNSAHSLPVPGEVRVVDPMGYGALLVAMVCTTIGLIWMVFVAYDYRQRWMQSLTTQNDRYIGGVFDMELDELYSNSSPIYEGYGLSQRSI